MPRGTVPEHTKYKQFKFTSENSVDKLKLSAHIFYNYLKISLSSKLYTSVVSYHSDNSSFHRIHRNRHNNALPCSFMYEIETTVGVGCGALAQ